MDISEEDSLIYDETEYHEKFVKKEKKNSFEEEEYPSISESKNEPLLSEEQTQNGAKGVTVKRKFRDFPAAVAFIFCFVFMTILAIIFHFSNKERVDPIPGTVKGFLLKTVSESIIPISIVGVIAALIGLVWVYFLRSVVKTTVWVTVYTIPVSVLIAAIWCFSNAINEPEGRITSIIFGLVFTGMSALLVFFVHSYMKKNIEITVKLMELACDILKDHPSIFVVSAVISVVYIILSLIWLWNFSRTFMLGFVSVGGSEPIWIFNPESYVIMAFFVFVFLWTSAVLSNVQSYILASITSMWYFHRNDFIKMRHNVVVNGCIQALTTSFGSICLGSLLVATANFLQIVANILVKKKFPKWRILQSIVSTTVNLIYRLTEIINRHAIAYCALTGEGFVASTKTVVSILKRNNFDRITIDVFARFALWLWCFSISCLFALVINTYGLKKIGTINSWAGASLGFAVCFFVLSFFSEILLKVIDALYVCFFVDIDANTGEAVEENMNVRNTFKKIISPTEQVVEVVEQPQ